MLDFSLIVLIVIIFNLFEVSAYNALCSR